MLTESRGISDVTVKYRDMMSPDLERDINSFVTVPSFNEHVFMMVYNHHYDFPDESFKIRNLSVFYKLYKYKEDVCNADVNLNTVTFEGDVMNNPVITLSIYLTGITGDFILYVKSVLLHEMNHLHEHYQLKVRNKFRPHYWSTGTIYPQLRNIIKNKDVLYVLSLIYMSLRHEISSNLHQYYDYKLKGKTYDKLIETRDSLRSFKPGNISLSDSFNSEMNMVKQHIIKSEMYFTTNDNYKSDINKSVWTIEDNKLFIEKLQDLFNGAADYIDRKISLIDKKFETVDYSGESGFFYPYFEYEKKGLFLKSCYI